MTQQLKTLAEYPGLAPRTHMAGYKHLKLQFQKISAHIFMHVMHIKSYKHTHVHKNKYIYIKCKIIAVKAIEF